MRSARGARLRLHDDDAPATETPLVFVLSEEVPAADLRAQPYETVTVHIDRVTGHQEITETVAAEHAAVTTHRLTRRAGRATDCPRPGFPRAGWVGEGA